MKHFLLITLFFSIIACDNFNVRKTSSEEILNDELQTFSWNALDVYPTFSICDSTRTKEEKKQCFETELTTHVMDYLSSQNFVVNKHIEDTLEVTFNISETGKAKITTISVTEETLLEIPNIREVISKSLDSLEQIFPAIKRGQQVKSQFKMPIIIGVD